METELVGNARSIKGDTRPNCDKCKHYRRDAADPVLIFSSPKHCCTKAIDLVTGDTIETDCYAMRHPRAECGPDAKLFEDALASPDDDQTAEPASLPDEQGMGEGWKAFFGFLGAIAILALAFWLAYEYDQDQPRVIKTGEVSVKNESSKRGSCCVTAHTRLLASGNRSFWQFEASPGEWKDCGDDCEKAVRRALAK